MRTRTLSRSFGLTALFLCLAASALRAADPQPPKGFTAIFNGKDLAGWHGMPHYDPFKLAAMPEEARKAQIEKWTEDAKKHWSVQNGELVNDGNGAYLAPDKDYGDIEFHIEYKTVAKADSGIYLKGCPQVQIWDTTKEGGKWNLGADKGSGALWNNSAGAAGKDPLVLADKPFGEWNSLKIRMIGERVTIHLNDKLVVDHARLENYWNAGEAKSLEAQLKKLPAGDESQKQANELKAAIERVRSRPLPAKGPIQLQTHGGEIRWRNIYLREIPAAEAGEILRANANKGFQSVFNAKDLEGWAGAVENYKVVDGAIYCKEGKGGVVYVNQDLTDFVARAEFKLPPGGNNGFAIRYPGTGDTAYKGMCELQVLDDDAPKYAKLDKRQYHGSAYGMAASHRGYQRPVGEWNFQEITVKGPTITVELNGTRILDTDLSKITDYMAKSPHPGKERANGFFGLAGHNDPVGFKNIEIKKLD